MKFLNQLIRTTLFCCLFACNSNPNQNAKEDVAKDKVAFKNTVPSPDSGLNKENSSKEKALPAENPPYIITTGQVGPIKIGMPVTELKEIVYKENLKEIAITREGLGYKAYELKLDPKTTEPDLLIEEICKPTCQVWRLHVKSKSIRTPEGLGVGSTLGEVKQFYNISFIGAGETEIVAVSEKSKITFLLDVSSLPEKDIPRLSISNTPNTVKIIGMFVI